MAVINRVGSPMNRLDESLDEVPEKINLRKQLLKAQQRTKSPFVIGSIEEVNLRISKLDQKLQNYTALVCESRGSFIEGEKYRFSNNRITEQYNKNAKETKEMNTFAGIYAVKSNLAPEISERAKNITKISMKPKGRAATITKGEAGKPKFVELCQYPGLDDNEATPLPVSLSPDDFYNKALQASGQLCFKPYSKSEFDSLLHSDYSKAIFLDMFWYVFLDKFQQNPASQKKLFDRVAHNYVRFLMVASDPFLKDLFFKNYPKLTSQAIYSAFCFSFPDSFRQFGESFKNYLTFLIYEWMSGLRPAPRSWLTWDMSTLEPTNIKQRENLMNKKNGNSLLNLNNLDLLVATNSKDNRSSSSADVSTSRSSNNSYLWSKQQRQRVPLQKIHLSSSTDEIQPFKKSQKKGRDKSWQNDPSLTPIQEKRTEEEEEEEMIKSYNQLTDPKGSQSYQMKSHPVGSGCDFVKMVFNTKGHSPLVTHFLQSHNLLPNAGHIVRIQRVEIENLPPLDAPTYTDVLSESSKKLNRMKKEYQNMSRLKQQENRKFFKEQQSSMKELIKKQTALLANKKEVKRLSDLIIMEQRKSEDSVSAGADMAIRAALQAQD